MKFVLIFTINFVLLFKGATAYSTMTDLFYFFYIKGLRLFRSWFMKLALEIHLNNQY